MNSLVGGPLLVGGLGPGPSPPLNPALLASDWSHHFESGVSVARIEHLFVCAPICAILRVPYISNKCRKLKLHSCASAQSVLHCTLYPTSSSGCAMRSHGLSGCHNNVRN